MPENLKSQSRGFKLTVVVNINVTRNGTNIGEYASSVD
jgi:hypothetical protein